jgi:hypothetical protein
MDGLNRRRSLAAVVTAAIVGLATLALPGRASADASCASGYFCVWYSNGWQGQKWSWYGNDSDWSNNDKGGYDINDRDLSWANNGVYCNGCDHVRVYAEPGHTIQTLCIHRGQWLDFNSGQVTLNAANEGSSHRWGGECVGGDKHIPFP